MQPNSRTASRLANIRIDVATAEAVQALERQGIAVVVLKGAALADWYPEGQPPYADGDLWVAPDDLLAATRIFVELGFQSKSDEDGLPDWWLQHASEWRRERDASELDLHRYLQGVGVSPERAWEILSSDRETFELAGKPALRLKPDGRGLYVALHAAHHGIQHVNGLRHLTVALDTLDDDCWRSAAELAIALEATEQFVTGLRLVPVGRELTDRLQIGQVQTARWRLKASSSPSAALTLDDLASASPRQRLSMFWFKLFPPAGFIRHWWAPANRGPLWLAIGYLYRPVWVLIQLPRGMRAYLAAHHRAKHGR